MRLNVATTVRGTQDTLIGSIDPKARNHDRIGSTTIFTSPLQLNYIFYLKPNIEGVVRLHGGL